MSSIATLYTLNESERPNLAEAKRREKTVTYKRGLFRTKEIISGDRYLWEYLDSSATQKIDFPHSGFVIVDYLFTLIEFTEDIQEMIDDQVIDEHYNTFDHALCGRIAAFLEDKNPSDSDFEAFARDEGRDPDGYIEALRTTHTLLVDWFRSANADELLVLHLTF